LSYPEFISEGVYYKNADFPDFIMENVQMFNVQQFKVGFVERYYVSRKGATKYCFLFLISRKGAKKAKAQRTSSWCFFF
jgi:hypothetical protein